MFCGKWLVLPLPKMSFVFYPSVRFFLLPEPFGIYRCFTGTGEQAVSDAFSGKLLFRRKEEFYRKCTSKRRNQARQSKFASGKPIGDGKNGQDKR